jgi:hypothetical protein
VEPTIIAAVVSASGRLLGQVIQTYGGAHDPKAQEAANKVIQRTYETLKGNFTDGCVRILKLLEDGNGKYPEMIRENYYPTLLSSQGSEAYMQALNREFEYRMEYLRLNGVVNHVAGREYFITRLGLAFLEEARRKRDYYGVLFES